VFEDTVTPPPTPVSEIVPDVYVVFEAAIPPTKVWVSGWTVCELTEIWNWFPVVDRIVTAPSSLSFTVPDV
jgi:hypothetical protein